MKYSEVLKRYKLGERNFQGKKLRGQNFEGQNLSGADFSKADIRGANFTRAILREAKFVDSEAGLQRRLLLIQLILSLLLSGVLTSSAVTLNALLVATFFAASVTKDYWFSYIFGAIIFLINTVIFVLIARQGFTNRTLGTAILLVSVLLLIIGIVFSFGSTILAAEAFISAVAGIAASIVIVVAAVGVGKLAAITTVALSVINAVVITILTASASVGIGPVAVAAVAVGAGEVILFSSYVAWCTVRGDEKFLSIRALAIAFASIGSTRFYQADLTDANFTAATLKITDFRKAILTRTCFHKTKKLDCVRPGLTYLQNTQLRQLLVSGLGQNKNFDRQDLRGVNLQEAKLENASFIDADFYQASLSSANFSRAILVRTNLERADLRGANLTGSCIQDWTISRGTKLDRIVCDYVYLKWVDGDKHDQMPPRGKFKEGGFVTFVKHILDTVELYHEKDINPRLALTVLQKMAVDYDEPLDVVALGKRGERIFVQVKVSERIIQEQLKEDYYSRYDNDLKLWASNPQQLLPSVDNLLEQRLAEITSEETDNFVFIDITHVESIKTTSEVVIDGKVIVEKIDTSGGNSNVNIDSRNINMGSGNYNERIEGDYVQGNSYGKRKQSSFNLQGAQFAGGLVDAETVNAHQIGGNITNYTQAARTETNNSAVKTILILASNPKTTTPLRLDEEVREIDAGLQRAKKRELFDLKQRQAVRVQDVYQSLLDFKPQFVHFSGHGSGDEGLVLEDETGQVRLVETVALAGLFELFANTIECVVLNACYSEVQARVIAQHIPYVIGMNKAIGDQAAIKFATGFYSALGAGESVEFAYKLGCSVIQLDGIAEHLTPVLKKK